jgi:hypothetical protein
VRLLAACLVVLCLDCCRQQPSPSRHVDSASNSNWGVLDGTNPNMRQLPSQSVNYAFIESGPPRQDSKARRQDLVNWQRHTRAILGKLDTDLAAMSDEEDRRSIMNTMQEWIDYAHEVDARLKRSDYQWSRVRLWRCLRTSFTSRLDWHACSYVLSQAKRQAAHILRPAPARTPLVRKRSTRDWESLPVQSRPTKLGMPRGNIESAR